MRSWKCGEEAVSENWENDEHIISGDWKTIEGTSIAGWKNDDPCYAVTKPLTKLLPTVT